MFLKIIGPTLLQARATFGRQIEPGSIVAGALADEPGWTGPALWVPTDTSTVVQARWVAYLRAQGMTPGLLGAASWGAVVPVRTSPTGTAALHVIPVRF
jgi:hypothetical protein